MTDLPEQYRADAVAMGEKLVDLIRRDAQVLLDGLADRPKPGAKARAREAVSRILSENAKLWRYVEGKKPLRFAP